MWTTLWIGCASFFGLRVLDELPEEFPIAIDAELGHVTTPTEGGQVSVDVVYDDAEAARAGWAELRARAEAQGFVVTEEGRVDKRDRVLLEGPEGRLELGCCPARADRRPLVLVTWWAPAR